MNNLIAQLVNPQIVATIRNLNAEEYLNRLIPMLIYIGLMLCAIAFILLFLIGGFQWITSGGNKQSLENARNKIVNAITGLLVLLLLWLILQFVNLIFGVNIGGLGIPRFGGGGGGSFPTQTPGGPTPTGGTVPGSCSWVNNNCSCTCPAGYTVLYDCGATADYICPSDDCLCALPTPTAGPSLTPTQAPVIGYYTITAVPVCSNGATPSIRTRFTYTIWPPDPFFWRYDSTAFVTGSHTVAINITSSQADDLYFSLENEEAVIVPPSNNNFLMPIGTPPTGMIFGRYWVPNTWQVHTDDATPPPQGSYTINFDVPAQYCSSGYNVVLYDYNGTSPPHCQRYCRRMFNTNCVGITTDPINWQSYSGDFVTWSSTQGCWTSRLAYEIPGSGYDPQAPYAECGIYLYPIGSAPQCQDVNLPQSEIHQPEWTYCICEP